MLINIISSLKAGGAELLVRELHKLYIGQNIHAYSIYLDGCSDKVNKNEIILGVNPRSPLNILRIRKILKFLLRDAESNTVVHIHLTWPFLYVTLASLFLPSIKLIYTEHSTTNKRRYIPFIWVMDRWFYSRFSQIICISKGVERALANWVGPTIARRLVTIPNGARIYSLAERPSLEGRFPRLVSIGRLSSTKNYITTIKAIAQLRGEVETYTIIGEGPERPRLERLIDDLKLGNKIRLLGWSDDIEAHLHAADMQLIPSLWEGFGLVAVEGMSTGLPVVASNVDGLREVLDEGNPSVIFVDSPESVAEWVGCIRTSVENICDKGFTTISTCSRQQAEKFTLEKMANQYLAIYRDVLAEPNN